MAIVVAPATKILTTSIVLSNPGINETVRRTRAIVSISSDQSVAIEDQVGAFGAVVVSDLALAAGAASIPGPFTDASDDGWFLWQGINASASGSVFGRVSYQYEIDSKAMRRVQDGFGVAFMIENASPTTTFLMTQSIALLSSLS